MKGVERLSSGSDEGGSYMFIDEKGDYVSYKDYKKLLEYNEELFDLAYNNCNGLAHDKLYEIVDKYKDN